MTTDYHDAILSSQSVTAVMRRINALEAAIEHGIQFKFGNESPNAIIGPHGIAVDSSGNIFVVGLGDHYVYKFTSTGEYVSKFGGSGSGNGQLSGPLYVAIDGSGNIFVTEGGNDRVQKFSAAGTYLAKWGTLGTGNGQFNDPNGIGIDSSGNVYVADSKNDRVQKFTSAGAYVSQWGGTGTGNGQFDTPTGLAVDPSDNIWVCDNDNSRVQKFSSSGAYILQIAVGVGIQGIASDADGNIYVAAIGDNTIKVYSTAGALLETIGPDIPPGLTIDGIHGIAIDAAGGIVANHFFGDDECFVVGPYDETEFFKYIPDPDSLGTPDGGEDVPALDGLVGTTSEVAAQIIEDMRDAIEALAPYYENSATGNPFNWTDAHADNLYSVAVDVTDYGDTGTQYDWHRTKAAMYGKFPTSRDIGEIVDCITLLEASDLA